MAKNLICVAGIETIRDKDGHVIKLSSTFVNNVNTYKKDHKKDNVTILDCRDYKDLPSPMEGLWKAVEGVYGVKGIDGMFITGHSDWEGIYLFSKIRKELGEEDRYITESRAWPFLFNPGAYIRIDGCQAGGRFGKKWPKCVAQSISDTTGATVYAFTSRSAQKRRKDGGFEQRPDYPGHAKFTPQLPPP